MAQTSPETLIRISKATKPTIDLWSEGVRLEGVTGRSIQELRHRAVNDRLELARQFLIEGEALLAGASPRYRSAISRLYYAMYHTMRAVSYFHHGGDDHEQHKTLPSHTPGDFPDEAIWQNALKDARERRNAADYNPYPKSDSAWRASALAVLADARPLLRIARRYLRGKGCQLT